MSGRVVVAGLVSLIVIFYASSYLPTILYPPLPLDSWKEIARVERETRPDFVLKEINKPYTDAISVWDAKLKQDPTNRLALLKLVQQYSELARISSDERYYRLAEQLLSDQLSRELPKRCELNVALARMKLTRHAFLEVVELSDGLLERCPNSRDVYSLKADALIGLGEYEQGFELAEKLFSSSKEDSISEKLRMVEVLHLQGLDNQALQMLSKVLKLIPGSSLEASIWIRLRIGIIYLKQNNLDAAKHFFEASLALAPDYFLGIEHLAEVHEERNEVSKAILLLEKAANIAQVAEIYTRLSHLYEMANDSEKAQIAKEKALEIYTSNLELGDEHAMPYANFLLEENGQLTLAKELMEKDLAMRPVNRESNLLMAKICRQLKDKTCAKEHLSTAAKINPALAEIRQEQKLINLL